MTISATLCISCIIHMCIYSLLEFANVAVYMPLVIAHMQGLLLIPYSLRLAAWVRYIVGGARS